MSEEGRHVPYEVRRRWEYYWLIDPLDGTKEFISRNGELTVNIALIHQDRPVLGVIFVPVSDVLYHAREGEGGGWGREGNNNQAAGLKTAGGDCRCGKPVPRHASAERVRGSPRPIRGSTLCLARKLVEVLSRCGRGS